MLRIKLVLSLYYFAEVDFGNLAPHLGGNNLAVHTFPLTADTK